MNITNSEKQSALNKLLFELAKSQIALKMPRDKSKIYVCLEDIYCAKEKGNDFRHYYSEIFSTLSQIDSDPELGDLETLAQNMYEIKNGYRPMNKRSKSHKDCIDVSPQINKLFDHVNLDIARIQYMKKIEMQTLESKEELSHVLNSANELKQSVSSMQKEYITILGIFSSIVLAFVGGITFSSSVLENIANTSVYRTLTVVVFIGFVFLNMINILVQFIIRINHKVVLVYNYGHGK
ncbi:MAG: hypothetical protein GX941_00475, partial [Candidatus Methanofastidiosa archaeon]|nr:hypothetical protein [Candidatus Methanofastidiosa archaeon]